MVAIPLSSAIILLIAFAYKFLLKPLLTIRKIRNVWIHLQETLRWVVHIYSTTSEKHFQKNLQIFRHLCSLHDSVCVCISALVQHCSSYPADLPLSIPHHCHVQLRPCCFCRVLPGSICCHLPLEGEATHHRETAPLSLCNNNSSGVHYGAFHLYSWFLGVLQTTL